MIDNCYSSNNFDRFFPQFSNFRIIFGILGFTADNTDFEPDYAVRSQDIPLDETNIGNKLLKSMGWTEGTGIGKNNQGYSVNGFLVVILI